MVWLKSAFALWDRANTMAAELKGIPVTDDLYDVAPPENPAIQRQKKQRQHPSTRADILGELTGGGTVIYRFVSTSLALFRLSSECSAVILCC